MDRTDTTIQVSVAHGDDGVQQSAEIWARARALRDHDLEQDPEPGTVDGAVLGIRRRLGLTGARLFLARRDDRPVGFILVAPRPETLEIFYLGVDPEVWGSGVATRLLRCAEAHAREIGREMLELWVITDNERAIQVYQRSGWVGTDEVHRDTCSGRLEQRFLKHVH